MKTIAYKDEPDNNIDETKAKEMENMNIGARCSLNYCNQKDFLPFKCKYCDATVCNYHFRNHECPKQLVADRRVTTCPKCHEKVYYTGEERDEAILQDHSKSSACVERPKQKTKRCPTCTAKLTLLNTFCCKECGVETCMKHRSSLDHRCTPMAMAKNTWRDMTTVH